MYGEEKGEQALRDKCEKTSMPVKTHLHGDAKRKFTQECLRRNIDQSKLMREIVEKYYGEHHVFGKYELK